MKTLIVTLFLIVLVGVKYSFTQNVAITDDDTYVANSSAMLDVKSLNKGLLVPRLTTVQRNAIVSPASGLLVFDTTLGGFYFYNGTSWTNITSGNASGLWSLNNSKVYLQNTNYRLGVGTTNPIGKMEVKSDAGIGINEPIFHVVNNNGDTVFAVYNQGVRINVLDDPAKASGSKGGFAVGGFSPAKGAFTNEFLRVTPDSVRIYIQDNPAKVSGSKGGFAVGGFSPAKTTATNYLDLTPNNYFIGHESGVSNTTGLYNSFVGYQSGKSNTTGSSNVFAGYKTGLANTEGWSNVFMGNNAGAANTIGNENVFIGNESGSANTDGSFNVFVGSFCGKSNIGGAGNQGNYNVFMGIESGFSNTIGSENVFIGYRTGYNNTTGVDNVFVGLESGRDNTTGSRNVFLGKETGHRNASGFANTFIGDAAGYYNQTGNNNTFIGYVSGYNNTGGQNNVFLGSQAGYMNTTGSYNLFLGYYSGRENTIGNYNTFMGYKSGMENTTGNYNTFVGFQSGILNTTGTNNVFMGYQSGKSNTIGTSNVFLGTNAGYSNIDGFVNVFIGEHAGYTNTTGTNDIFIGYQSGFSNTTSSGNIFMGRQSGYSNTTGWGNLFLGNYSGFMNVSGSNNVYLGYNAGMNSLGEDNVYIGQSSSTNNANGLRNVSIGASAGFWAAGSDNVFIGNQAGYNEAGNNKLYIANTSTNNPLIYGDFFTNNIVINGNLKTTGILYDKDGHAGTYGQILSSTVAGTDWINLPTGITGTGTANQIAFWTGANALSCNSKLYWNNISARLGINTTPSYKLHVIDDDAGDNPAIFAQHNITDNYGIGLYAKGGWKAIVAENTSTTSVNYSVVALANGIGGVTNYGIYSTASGAATNYAGYFQGNVHVNGTLSKSAGSFKIDHPLDPENKYLSHSFVESPDMKNIYDGVVILDNQGKAVVNLPNYFSVLNKDFRYQLTTIGAFAQVYIEQEIDNNQFIIGGGTPGLKVSWQVTGIRKDKYAITNPIIVEENKKQSEIGKYLNPELFNKSYDYSINKTNK